MSDAAVLPGVFLRAVDNFNSDHTVTLLRVEVVLAEFLASLVPLHAGHGLAGQTAQQLAGLVELDDSGPEEEGEDRRGVGLLLPEVVVLGGAGADALLHGLVGGRLRGQR